jgi:hypothetical protein
MRRRLCYVQRREVWKGSCIPVHARGAHLPGHATISAALGRGICREKAGEQETPRSRCPPLEGSWERRSWEHWDKHDAVAPVLACGRGRSVGGDDGGGGGGPTATTQTHPIWTHTLLTE